MCRCYQIESISTYLLHVSFLITLLDSSQIEHNAEEGFYKASGGVHLEKYRCASSPPPLLTSLQNHQSRAGFSGVESARILVEARNRSMSSEMQGRPLKATS